MLSLALTYLPDALRCRTHGGRAADAMRKVIRLFFILAFLCNVSGSGMDVRAQALLTTEQQKSEERFHVAESRGKACLDYAETRKRSDEIQQIKQNDGYLNPVAEEPQSPVEVAFRSAPSSHRIASSRPTRLLPTHGGKPTNHGGRWAKGESFNPLTSPSLRLCSQFCWHRTTAASPRLRYVIALRRLLC